MNALDVPRGSGNPPRSLHPPKKRVVVLDDDVAMLRALERLLTRGGLSVTTTTEPQRAIDLVVSGGADAIVSDLHMPDMGGNLVLAFLAKAAPKTARLLLTSETDFDTVALMSAPFSVDAFVPKRDVSARLLATLDEMFRSRAEDALITSSDHARELARGIVRAVAMRDLETEAHCARVAAWSRRLALALGLPDPRVLDTELGALLHDVGKIGIRDAVLLKKAPLTPSEWEEMRQHPELGRALLQEIPALHRAIAVVQNHHERWDGSGYPRGLSGMAIPLEARIFQIADAYDAIRSDRPYRKGRSDHEARAEILRHVGPQFDPDIHHAFTSIDRDDWMAATSHLPRGAVTPE